MPTNVRGPGARLSSGPEHNARKQAVYSDAVRPIHFNNVRDRGSPYSIVNFRNVLYIRHQHPRPCHPFPKSTHWGTVCMFSIRVALRFRASYHRIGAWEMEYDRRIKQVFDRAAAGGHRAAKAAPARSGARGDPAPVFQQAYGGGVRALDQALHLFFGEAPSRGTGGGGGDGVSESSRGGAQGRRVHAESGALGAPVSVQGGARPRARVARRAASRHARDLEAGLGEVSLPYARSRNYPRAGSE